MVVRRRRQRGLVPAVVGASALLLVACGATDTISADTATPTPAIQPNACSLLSDSQVAAALALPATAGSAAPAASQQLTHLYSVTTVNLGGTKTVGQCNWMRSDGAQVIGLVIPNADITKLADFTTGATQAGGAYIQQGQGRGFISVQNGGGVVAFTVVLDVDPSVRTVRLADLARAAASGAKIPVITAAPGTAAASPTPGGPVANAPGQIVQNQTAAQKVKETDTLLFNPTAVTVKAGEVVQWDNTGSVAHNVTFDDSQSITSDTMNGGDKYQVKFTKAGTYSYRCTFHPGMNGKVTVQ
jgi:plastocyanin